MQMEVFCGVNLVGINRLMRAGIHVISSEEMR